MKALYGFMIWMSLLGVHASAATYQYEENQALKIIFHRAWPRVEKSFEQTIGQYNKAATDPKLMAEMFTNKEDKTEFEKYLKENNIKALPTFTYNRENQSAFVYFGPKKISFDAVLFARHRMKLDNKVMTLNSNGKVKEQIKYLDELLNNKPRVSSVDHLLHWMIADAEATDVSAANMIAALMLYNVGKSKAVYQDYLESYLAMLDSAMELINNGCKYTQIADYVSKAEAFDLEVAADYYTSENTVGYNYVRSKNSLTIDGYSEIVLELIGLGVNVSSTGNALPKEQGKIVQYSLGSMMGYCESEVCSKLSKGLSKHGLRMTFGDMTKPFKELQACLVKDSAGGPASGGGKGGGNKKR